CMRRWRAIRHGLLLVCRWSWADRDPNVLASKGWGAGQPGVGHEDVAARVGFRIDGGSGRDGGLAIGSAGCACRASFHGTTDQRAALAQRRTVLWRTRDQPGRRRQPAVPL